MPDNVTLNPGSGGTVMATDDIGGAHWQRVKLTIGADGINGGDVSTANPLPTTPCADAAGSGTVTDRQSALSNAAIAIKATAGRIYGYNLYNPGSALAYVHFYDLAQGSVTVGTTTPKLSIALPSTSSGTVAVDAQLTIPVTFSTAITIAATTTPAGGAAPSIGIVTNLLYK